MSSWARITSAALLLASLGDPVNAKDKPVSGPAPASTAAAPTTTGNQPANNTSASNNPGGGGTANLASWLAAIAAQDLGNKLSKNIGSYCPEQCLVMAWPDYIAAQYRIHAVEDQLVTLALSDAVLKVQLLELAKKCPAITGTPPKPSVNQFLNRMGAYAEIKRNTGIKFNISADSPASASTAVKPIEAIAQVAANVNLAGTAVNTIIGIYKAVQPTYSFGSASLSGITNDDLIVAIQASAPDKFLLSPPIEGDLRTVITNISTDIGDLSSSLQRGIDDQHCSSIKPQLTELQSPTNDLKDQVNALVSAVNSGTSNLSSFTQDDALFTYIERAKNNKKQPRMLDLTISSSAASSGNESHFLGSDSQILQSNLIARYRVFDMIDNTVKVAGNDAVYCQTKADIQEDATSFSGQEKGQARSGDMAIVPLGSVTSRKPLCYDRSLVNHD
jgi:hypothetical protein